MSTRSLYAGFRDFVGASPMQYLRELRLDLRDPAAWQRVDAVLARHRPGPTPLRLHLQVGRPGQDGATGVLDLNGGNSVRIAPPLLDALRAQPGVRAVKVAISRPWAN